MMELHRLTVRHAGGAYPILIGHGLLGDAAAFDSLPAGGAAVIVTNATVAPLYAGPLRHALATRYSRVDVVELPDGEQHKTLATLEIVLGALLAEKHDRKCTLFALGGGVVGDIAGFAAACYMRGIAYVQVPTTLLAQTDSSVGGKTAVNHALGKNMIGAFHQPLRVIIDLDTLETLPAREYVAGVAEVIKYGAAADAAFFDWLESNLDRLLAREPDALSWAIRRSCEIKAGIVERDERESGERALLNFGHTTGHAIEAGAGYGIWLHGEAVAIGMAVAAELSVMLGSLEAPASSRLRVLLQRAGLPVRPPPMSVEQYLSLMERDKKSESGSLHFVLLKSLGRSFVQRVDSSAVSAALAISATF